MAKEAKNKEKKVKPSKGKSSFVKDTKAELKRVIWPNPKQLLNNTVAVISVVVIIGIIVFVLDFCFNKINSFGVDKLKEIVKSENIIEDEEKILENSSEDSSELADETNTSEAENETIEAEAIESENQGE